MGSCSDTDIDLELINNKQLPSSPIPIMPVTHLVIFADHHHWLIKLLGVSPA